jgi:N-acetyl-anhydromuramyl-L-alanine amidase AmpD
MFDLNAVPYIPARNFTRGRYQTKQPTLIVIHDMEAGEYSTTAESCANYFAGLNAPMASAHYACDNDSTVCCVKPEDTAWHTGENVTNNCGIGIEQAGFANQSYQQWTDEYSMQMITGQVAPLVAALCGRYGIPVRFLGAADLRAGDYNGITSHREITFAYQVPGGHTDPGPDYPFDVLFTAVNQILNPTNEGDDEMKSVILIDPRDGKQWHVFGNTKVHLTDMDQVNLLLFLGVKQVDKAPVAWIDGCATIPKR